MSGKNYIDCSMSEFSNDLGAKKTMPGGGSAAAYVATLANSLASMVANFTVGKKKYAQFDDDIKEILEKAENLNDKVIDLVDEDIRQFLPLADAYKMPSTTENEKKEKELELQRCLKNAAKVPMDLLKICNEILYLHEELLEKGSKMLISDVGVGVQFLRASALSAKLNILINLNSINDEDFKNKYKVEMDSLVESVVNKCDFIYEEVLKQL
ncbi:cyclodeaminase/cyclohydrolase family protein [Peptostreptococcus faecalis]|uniref:cyclodeaminase/cyclohydrolase family protein n=1 Tax=Peptostreptococcus faecalis TaxID=2045015 RepID=UPI000C7A82EE|nr:cyclodeaminase/cyclohydrolase family protein [Peptostreptococcus faecalis]